MKFWKKQYLLDNFNSINKTLLSCLLILLLAISSINVYSNRNTTTKKTTTTKKKPQPTKSKAPAKKTIPPNSHLFIADTMLASGIFYKHLLVTINGIKHNVNIIQVDLNNDKAEIEVVKGGNNIVELERLPEMLCNSKIDTSIKEFVGGLNANF